MTNTRNNRWLKGDFCTWFPDKVFGVDIGLACYDHDAAYAAGHYRLKWEGDKNLFRDVWEIGNRQEGWRGPAIKAVAGLMFAAVATVGNLFWLRSRYGTDKSN